MSYSFAYSQTAGVSPGTGNISGSGQIAGAGSGSVEGTAVLSTGEVGAVLFLREDGDGTCSWQTPSGAGDVTAASNLGDNLLIRGDGAVKGVQNSGITVDDSDNITGLGDLTGTSGQMTLTGGTASGDDILITSTSNATKGYIGLGSLTAGLVYDETNHRFSMGVDEFETTIAGFAVGSKLTTHTEGAADALDIMQHRHSDVGILGTAQAFARSRGTEASETAVQDGDSLAKLLIYGHDGTDYEAGASIEFEVDGTVAAGAMGTAMFFSTTPDGSATVVERMRIAQDGAVTINGATDFDIGGASRVDITSSGLRLGNTGVRASIIYDQDDMSSDSAVALASQQSIKAYVDAHPGTGLNTALSNPDAPIEISASNNDAGTGNTYFGASAGSNIISGGNYNTFFGLSSGN
ncbi:MAG: hypothetical protein GY782_04850, partial [Gammaproteobacteria bacterium]|nr:hypothetical protein [Gammaproteobacteria bacterium]